MALFKSPPFIKPLSNKASNSWRKLKVLASDISDLKSEIFYKSKILYKKSYIIKFDKKFVFFLLNNKFIFIY
jgi:hypothetical protein